MGALADLRQLLRIPEQQQVAGGAGHRDGVGEAELSGLFDDQQIQALRCDPVGVGEVPRRSADDASVVPGDELRVLVSAQLGPRRAGRLLLADPIPGDPGGQQVAEQVLHHGMRLGDHPDAPVVPVDQRRQHLGGGVRLAGARRPVHRQVRVVEVEQRTGDVGDDVAGAGQRVSAAGPRIDPQQHVGHRARCQCGQTLGDRRRGRRDRLLQWRGVDRRARRQRERRGGERLAVFGLALDDHHRAGDVGVVALHNGHRGEAAAVGVVGQPRRCGRVVQGEHLAGQLTGGDIAEQLQVPLRTARPRWGVPVGDDLVPLGDEHAAAVGPFLHRIVDPVEVRPPERLVFALVEALGRGVHRDGDLVRIAGLDAVPGEFEQRPLDVVDGNGFGGVGAARHRLRAAGRHPGFDGARHQPVPQPTGGAAVVAVVVLDGFQDRRGAVGVPGVAQFTEPGVFGDRRRRGGDLAVAQFVAHVERLEALDAVVLGAHPDALAHQGIQIDEHAVAQQFVDLLLADPVAARQPQQRALLVGRVVVDVHARIPLAPLAHQGQEVAQRLTFFGAVVGPEGMELIGDAEHAPQVLQPPLVPVGGPQRITLEVEEQVALVRVGQHHQGLGVDHAVRRQSVGPVGHLQPGLLGQRRHGAGRQFRHRPGVRRQVVHGRDAGIDQPRALTDPHAGDQQ